MYKKFLKFYLILILLITVQLNSTSLADVGQIKDGSYIGTATFKLNRKSTSINDLKVGIVVANDLITGVISTEGQTKNLGLSIIDSDIRTLPLIFDKSEGSIAKIKYSFIPNADNSIVFKIKSRGLTISGTANAVVNSEEVNTTPIFSIHRVEQGSISKCIIDKSFINIGSDGYGIIFSNIKRPHIFINNRNITIFTRAVFGKLNIDRTFDNIVFPVSSEEGEEGKVISIEDGTENIIINYDLLSGLPETEIIFSKQSCPLSKLKFIGLP